MKIPKNCAECHMTYRDEVDYRICAIIGKNIDYGNANEIHQDCPLVEIITCKDCNYCRSDVVEGITCYWCDKDKCVTNENFYCANAVKGRE